MNFVHHHHRDSNGNIIGSVYSPVEDAVVPQLKDRKVTVFDEKWVAKHQQSSEYYKMEFEVEDGLIISMEDYDSFMSDEYWYKDSK